MEEQYGNSYADFTNDAAKKESIYANSASLIPIIRKRTGSAYGICAPSAGSCETNLRYNSKNDF